MGRAILGILAFPMLCGGGLLMAAMSMRSFTSPHPQFNEVTALGVAAVLASLVEIALVAGGMIAFFKTHVGLEDGSDS